LADLAFEQETGRERERMLEALESYRQGLSEPSIIRKWNATLGVPNPVAASSQASKVGVNCPSSGEQASPEGQTMAFVISTDEVDRHGDVITTAGWQLDSYKRNPVFLWAHDYARPAIGKASEIWKEPHVLMARMQFAPTEFAQEVASLYRSGYQRGVSVGFKPLRFEERRDEKTGAFLGLRFLEQELLETSAVPVPANSNALRRAMSRASLPEAMSNRCLKAGADEAALQSLWPELSARLDDLEKLAGELAQMVRQIEGEEQPEDGTAGLQRLLTVLRGAKPR
jgi:HK97 family phage prohead protease